MLLHMPNIKIVGVVEGGMPKVKICLDEACSKKSFSLSSLAAFLKIGIHDSVERLMTDK